MNPEATPFTFTATPSIAPKKKNKQKEAQISPEAAKIDYLNLELNAAKNRIAQLEATVNDRDGTIRIQKEKIKIFEENRINSVNSELLNNSKSTSSTRSDTLTSPPCCNPCHQVHVCCQPSRHHQYDPCCHHGQRQAHNTELDNSLPQQLAILNEIKGALGNINLGIVTIADRCAAMNVIAKNDAESHKAAPTAANDTGGVDTTSDHSKSPRKEAPTSKSANGEPATEKQSIPPPNAHKGDPDHIDCVSVEIINNHVNDDSIASADECVPEISIEPASLNWSDPTSQQPLLMQ